MKQPRATITVTQTCRIEICTERNISSTTLVGKIVSGRSSNMSVSERQIASVISLPGEERFKHFIKVVVDREEAWGLYQDGWAMASTNDGQSVFPLWPREVYATLCAVGEWKEYKPKPITLSDVIEVLLPKLKVENALPGIFYTPSGRGVTPSVERLIDELKQELTNY